MPPTYFKSPPMMVINQTIVDTYGICTYQEANPALISVVTFPFLFGMMYGDCGHASLVMFLGLFLVLTHKEGGPPSMIGDARYFLLLSGFFGTYCGLIYNEWFALPINLFDSCYHLGNKEGTKDDYPMAWKPSESTDVEFVQGKYFFPRKDYDCVYPWGYDPVWYLTSNNLTVSNQIKMKISVIFGVLHMMFGIIHKGCNGLYFRNKAIFWVEAVGGSCILLFWFGWMDLLVFCKWFFHLDIFDTTRVEPGVEGSPYVVDVTSQHMPSAITIVINTFFKFGSFPNKETDFSYVTSSNDTQYNIALALTLIAILIIPLYLCFIPCYARSPNTFRDVQVAIEDDDEVNQTDGS